MEGSHSPEQNSERQTPSDVNSTTDQSLQAGACDVQSAVADTLPTQESLAATSSPDVASTSESAPQSMGALFSRKARPAPESSTGKEGSGEQEASVQVEGSVVGDGTECQVTSVTSGTSVSDRSKGEGEKSTDHKSSKQAGATSVVSGKGNVKQQPKQSSFVKKFLPAESVHGQSKLSKANQLERIREERGNVSCCFCVCLSLIFLLQY